MADLGITGIGDATLIASGGSALVYRAVTGEGQPVAIKVLRGMRGAEVDRRFRREYAAAALLQGHPNIIDIHDHGFTQSGEPYLVLPLEVGSLQDELDANGPFPVARAIADVVTAANAIEFAHRNGVLHRDIKPGNLLRTDSGSIVVTDFGIARVTDAGITSATVGAATPLYAAPELLAENEASVQSEVYALGALTYALLAGRPSFSDTPNLWATMSRIRSESPASIEGVPAPVMRAIEQAMAKDPGDRPPRAGLFAQYLQTALDAGDDWTPPRPAPATEPLPAPPPPLVPIVVSPTTPLTPDIRRAAAGTSDDVGADGITTAPIFDEPSAPALPNTRLRSAGLKVVASVAAVALIAGLSWWGATELLGQKSDGGTTAGEGPSDPTLPPPDRDNGTTTPGPSSTPGPSPTPTTRLVSFTGDHFTALFPEGWAVVSRDIDVGYGFRSRFVAEGMYLNVDTTPDYIEAGGGDDIEASARSVAAGISSASAVSTEQVGDLTLYSFMFRNNQGVDSIDIFFEVDGDGYAIVAGSNVDPQNAFATARQVALTVRGTPPL